MRDKTELASEMDEKTHRLCLGQEQSEIADLRSKLAAAEERASRAEFRADQKFALRREVEEILGVASTPASDEQLSRGIEALRALRDRAQSATSEVVQLRTQLAAARADSVREFAEWFNDEILASPRLGGTTLLEAVARYLAERAALAVEKEERQC